MFAVVLLVACFFVLCVVGCLCFRVCVWVCSVLAFGCLIVVDWFVCLLWLISLRLFLFNLITRVKAVDFVWFGLVFRFVVSLVLFSVCWLRFTCWYGFRGVSWFVLWFSL